jgi:hypothetical protein
MELQTATARQPNYGTKGWLVAFPISPVDTRID